MKTDIERLKDDNEYYGDFGKKFLSASDVGALLDNPASFKDSEETLNMLHGSYFHMLLLEPHKKDEFPIVEASSRNTKVYKESKEALGVEMLMLREEADELEALAAKASGNFRLHELIYGSDCEYEQPAIGEIHGNMWKGKCDIKGKEYVIDIKTSANINKFKSSAWAYNYDSQAWVYRELFGLPVLFIVACKKTGQLALLTCSDEFYQRGEDKVLDATLVYNKYYAEDSTEDISNHLIEYEL